jgi:hypothetical protein
MQHASAREFQSSETSRPHRAIEAAFVDESRSPIGSMSSLASREAVKKSRKGRHIMAMTAARQDERSEIAIGRVRDGRFYNRRVVSTYLHAHIARSQRVRVAR